MSLLGSDVLASSKPNGPPRWYSTMPREASRNERKHAKSLAALNRRLRVDGGSAVPDPFGGPDAA
jgi:hypothetical protein